MPNGRDPALLSIDDPARSLGVFDSGVGGLSVLRALRDATPDLPMIYLADTANAPYGERGEEFVVERSLRIASHLLGHGAAGLVVACNTATAAAVKELRERWPDLPIIGVEPGLKPAAAATRNGRVGVLATSGTLASRKFQALLQAQPAGVQVVARACPGLAALIERGDLQAPELLAAVEQHCAALRAGDVDTVVLGCTHYAFVRDAVQAAMGPATRIIDTAEAVARQALARIGPLPLPAVSPARVRLMTTGSAPALRAIANAWLGFECSVEAVTGC